MHCWLDPRSAEEQKVLGNKLLAWGRSDSLFVSPMNNLIISDQRLKNSANSSGRCSLVKATRVWTGATMGTYLTILRQAPVKEHF